MGWMMLPMWLDPTETKAAQLCDQVRAGNREAAIQLAHLLGEPDLLSLAVLLYPDGLIPEDVFDTIADARALERCRKTTEQLERQLERTPSL